MSRKPRSQSFFNFGEFSHPYPVLNTARDSTQYDHLDVIELV
ncbi:MAG: hypothetical protein Q8N96_16300 [Methylovulum sp.]|nr:hypothetical protein [Methylovulum sp.]